MFFCEKCRVKNDWPTSMGYPFMGISYGPCEVCKKVGECHDVPSVGLRKVRKAQSANERSEP